MEIVSSPWNSSIDCAILRDDGRIEVQIDGVAHRPHGAPRNVRQIATSLHGLSLLDRDGVIYHLSGAPNSFCWNRDERLASVLSIGCLASGQLCATISDGTCWEMADDGWRQQERLSQWIGEANKQPRKAAIVRKCLIAVVCSLVVLFAYQQFSRVRKQEKAVRLLEARGLNVTYAHEIDPKNASKNPPGPEWLHKILGVHWFVTPVRLIGAQTGDGDLSEIQNLPTLTHIDLQRAGRFDFKVIERLSELSSLKVTTGNYVNLGSLGEITSLHELWLSVSNVSLQRFLPTIAKLRELRSLTIWSSDRHALVDLTPLAGLEQLQTLDLQHSCICRIANLKSLSRLETLRATVADLRFATQFSGLRELRLSLASSAPRRDLAELAALTRLRALSINGQNGSTDGKWLAHLSQLEELSLTGTSLADQSGLHSLKKLAKLRLHRRSIDVGLLKETQLSPTIYKDSNRYRLDHCNVKDLAFLLQSPDLNSLYRLYLNHNPLSDLRPLLRLPKPLMTLEIRDTNVSDISCVAKMPKLRRLDISGTKVTDLSPLSGNTNLAELYASDTPVDRVQLVAASKTGVKLDLSGTKITDLDQVQLSNRVVHKIDLSRTGINDLQSINDWPTVFELNLSQTKVHDISPLRERTDIVKLDLSATNVRDITPLEGLRRLQHLNLSGTRVTGLSPLRYLPLVSLDLSRTATDATSLANLSESRSLRSLNLSGLPIKDLSVLKNTTIRTLDLSDTRVATLADLQSYPGVSNVSVLNLQNTNITMAMLSDAGVKGALQRLDLRGCPCTELDRAWLSTLQRLEFLGLDCERIRDLSPLGEVRRLKIVELENIQDDHQFDWLGKTRTTSLRLSGKPFDLTHLHHAIGQTLNLNEITFPSGTKIDFARFPLFKTIECEITDLENDRD